jgi:nicotinamidase-related amidase
MPVRAMGGLKEDLGRNAVHLCIDMQRLFSDEGVWPTRWLTRVLPNVIALAEHAPPRTIFTRFVPPRFAEDATGQWRLYYSKWPEALRNRLDPRLLELLPSLCRFVPPAATFDKPVYSAFASVELHQRLRRRSVDTLIVSGSETDVCVLSSVLGAVDLGYRVIVAGDAVCSSSDASHDALIGLFKSRFDVQIEIAKVEEILEAWPQINLTDA